jgi:hypothetical protein
MCVLRWLFFAVMLAILTAAQGGDSVREATAADPPPQQRVAERSR